MKVFVLFGGLSNERDVSIRSAHNVISALKQAGHNVASFDTKTGLHNIEELISEYDVIFPMIHGHGGEDGSLQKVLDASGCKYVGSGAEASKLCFNKVALKQKIKTAGIMTPDWEVVTKSNFLHSPIVQHPFVLKPITGGSSIDTHIVRDPSQYAATSIDAVFQKEPKMLLEKLIDGIEATVAILGDQALPVIEIIPPKNEEFDYENKYNGKSYELCPPENIPEDIQEALKDIALQVHSISGARHYSRVDFMIKESTPYVLEINTIPGMTEQSLFPRAAMAVSIDMPTLVDSLVKSAFGQ